MSVPEHISVSGEGKLVMPEEKQFCQSTLKMEVPTKLRICDLKTDSQQKVQEEKVLRDSLSSNIENPYEEALVLRKRVVVLAAKIKQMEQKMVYQKRRERLLLVALIGACVTMAWNIMRR
ncbi:unnamed protein product [Caenorhabditis bovis]|uniref:Uncharacterized protein n=1 Tax=Caenorhabditis bovis TaxID=2654633 RepID=A0A8S1ELB6_9PELO|nr:unnamed protein product [Caenorhabditis bovis]